MPNENNRPTAVFTKAHTTGFHLPVTVGVSWRSYPYTPTVRLDITAYDDDRGGQSVQAELPIVHALRVGLNLVSYAQQVAAHDVTRTAEDAKFRPIPGDVRVDPHGLRSTCARSTSWAVAVDCADGVWPVVWWASDSCTFIPAHLVNATETTKEGE